MSYWKRLKRSAKNKKLITGIFVALAVVASSLFAFTPVSAATNDVNMYMFWGDGCPHCARAKTVLEPYVEQHGNMHFYKFEVYYSTANQQKMQAVGETLGIDASGVPLIVVGDTPFIGYTDSIGDDIKERLEYCSAHACPDSIAAVVGVNNVTSQVDTDATEETEEMPAEEVSNDTFDVPILGTIDAAHVSLPIVTIIIALLDGFNPCAMWVLLFLITMLIGMKDRRKMWLYGVTFLATSAVVYFVFMAAWLNLFMFIGHITWVRVAIGAAAIAVGVYYLYDWYQKKTGCKVTGKESRKATFAKIKKIIHEKNTWLALGGIMLLAAAVNIVELACSAGLPVVYTGILSSAGLETWQYYAYMLLYMLFFMLDDLIVFFIAMKTLLVVGVEAKYMRTVRLVGGIVMCILGILLIFAPQILMFG